MVVQRRARWRGCWQILGMVSRDARRGAALCSTEYGAGGGVGDANAMAMPSMVMLMMAMPPMAMEMATLVMAQRGRWQCRRRW